MVVMVHTMLIYLLQPDMLHLVLQHYMIIILAQSMEVKLSFPIINEFFYVAISSSEFFPYRCNVSGSRRGTISWLGQEDFRGEASTRGNF